MNPWTTPAQLKERVQKAWDRGTLPAAFWSGEGEVLPYRVVLKGPSSDQWSDLFDQARRWIGLWEGYPVEWREFVHPRLGKNRVPTAVVFSTWDELLGLIGKKSQAGAFVREADRITQAFPELRPWVLGHPAAVLSHQESWPRLLLVLGWIRQHPRPGIYLRQLDLPGVHTKFVEAHRGLLADLLDLVLSPGAYDGERTRASEFAERYGFLAKPRLVRFRHLDPGHQGPRDQTWRLDDWARWDSAPSRVFITENEINFLAFPDLSDALVVFGAGYGFEGWSQVGWLQGAQTWYWGDLDTHGFAILDQLRSSLPGVRSFLMDPATLLGHRAHWGEEPQPVDRELPRLTAAEHEVYRGLVADRWAPRLRLEQEKIGYAWVSRAVQTEVPQ